MVHSVESSTALQCCLRSTTTRAAVVQRTQICTTRSPSVFGVWPHHLEQLTQDTASH